MGKRTDLDVAELVRAYEVGESASILSRRFRCSVWSIITRLRSAGVEVRSANEQNARWLGDRDFPADLGWVHQIVDGLLLGDGGLDPKGCLRLEQSIVRVGWLESLQTSLREHGCETTIIPIPPKTRVCEGRLINGGEARLLYSVCYREFQAQRARWYPQGVKVIPRDLTLTPLSLAQWLAGDGTYTKAGELTFCTDGFTVGDVQYLAQQLEGDLGIRSTTPLSHRGQPKLHVHRKDDALRLAEMVRPWLPECCLYKIQHTRARKSNPQWLRSRKLAADDVREIRQVWLSGAASLGSLAKQYGVAVSTIANIAHLRTYCDVG